MVHTASAASQKLFDAHQTYVYSVFLLKVKESFLKDIIINQNNGQGQDIWEEITFACENSMSVEVKANALLQYITSVKYDDGKWRGTSKAFIIHWCKQLWQYNQLRGKAGTVTQFTDPVKVQMLQNTVDDVAEFRDVRTVAQQIGHTPNSGNLYTFNDYKALLLTTADTYDHERSAKRCPTWQAQLHDTYDYGYGYEYKCNDRYNIDTSIDTIYANAAQSHQVMVPTNKWRQLLQEGRKQWGMLSDANRSVLLHADSMSTLIDSQASSRGSFCQTGTGRPQEHGRKVNWAEVDGTASSATATTKETASSEDMDTNLMDDICEQLGIDMETLYMASCCNEMARATTEANKQRHKHWKPPKGSGLPASDVHCMMAA